MIAVQQVLLIIYLNQTVITLRVVSSIALPEDGSLSL
jgi:hypothetical protein